MLTVTCCDSTLPIAAAPRDGEPMRSGSLTISRNLPRVARRGGPIDAGAADGVRIDCERCGLNVRTTMSLLHRVEALLAAAGGPDSMPLRYLRERAIPAAKRTFDADAMTPQTAEHADLLRRAQTTMQHDTPHENP